MEDLNRQGKKFVEEWNNKKHSTTGRVPNIHFMQDEYHLLNPLPEEHYYTKGTTERKVSPDSYVSIGSNKYSVPVQYVGKKVINPANHEEIPIIADDYVDIEFGTGAMKCTPAHDPNDWIIGQKYGLEHPIIMNIDGTMADNCGKYAGLDRYKCRELLLENIKNEGNLIKIEDIVHNVGHSERSGEVVEPILSKQWFVKMKPLAEAVLKQQQSENKAEFFPSRFSKVLDRWMSECDDWCISRQLWWGHQIPVYYNKHNGEILVSETEPKDIENWTRDEDVLDTWFSSALWPFGTMGWPENTDDYERYYPVDVMVTGYDIIFFWVARMYFQGLHFTGKTPFKHILIHGLVRDSKGRKMSKSSGNGVDPFEVVEKYGIDSLRYFLATTSAPGLDMRYSDEKVNSCSNYLNKIWNSARFILMNIPEDYDESKVDLSKLGTVDKFILSKLEKTIQSVTKAMETYEYGIASTNLYNFVYDDFCSFYIEMTKVSLNDDKYYKPGTYFTLLKVLSSVVMMIYPFSPFITEEIYQNLPSHKDSIMLESYPEFEQKFVDEKSEEKGELLKQIIEDIRCYKVDSKLAPNAKIDLSIKSTFDISDLTDYISRFSFASSLKIVENDVSNSTNIIYKNLTLFIVDNIDKNELKNNLENELQKIESEIKRSEGLLNNENFVNKAPQAKLDLEKNKYQDYLKKRQEILEKLKNI